MDEQATQNNVAQGYETRYAGHGLRYHQPVVEEMLAGLCGYILDLGCGTGIVSRVADVVAPDVAIHGVDFSHEMIARNPHLCELGDAESLRFEEGTFDGVVCRGVLHHLVHPARGVAEIARVLKPGGRVVFLEPNKTWVTAFPRWVARFTPWFSRQHKNFRSSELYAMVQHHLDIRYIGWRGYVAYPLLGYPDIVSLPMPTRCAEWLIRLDHRLSRSPLRRLGFTTLIHAQKR